MSRLAILLLVAVFVVVERAQGHGSGIGQPSTFVCPGNGLYADHGRDCVPYYRCEGDQVTALGCENGKRFDEKWKRCRLASLVKC